MAGKVVNYSTFLLGTNLRSNQNNTAFQWPSSLTVALLSTNNTDNNLTSIAEAPYTGYTAGTSRKTIANSTSGWAAPSGSGAVTMTNAALITFPTATGSGSITGGALCCDTTTSISTQVTFSATGAVTGGTVYTASISTQTVNNTNPVTIAIGALSLSED